MTEKTFADYAEAARLPIGPNDPTLTPEERRLIYASDRNICGCEKPEGQWGRDGWHFHLLPIGVPQALERCPKYWSGRGSVGEDHKIYRSRKGALDDFEV